MLHIPPDLDVRDFSGGVHISRTPQGLLFEGIFKAVTILECVRCLELYDQPLEANFIEVFSYNTHDFTESGLLVPEDGNIDLDPIVREYMMLDAPIKPLCKPDCQGLCTVCGENLNLGICEHQAHIKIE